VNAKGFYVSFLNKTLSLSSLCTVTDNLISITAATMYYDQPRNRQKYISKFW